MVVNLVLMCLMIFLGFTERMVWVEGEEERM